MNISTRLAQARIRAGRTQGEIAQTLGLSQARLSQIEHGQNTRIDTLLSYARALGFELVLVPQQRVRQVSELLKPVDAAQERPSRFPTLAEINGPQEAPQQRRRSPRSKA